MENNQSYFTRRAMQERAAAAIAANPKAQGAHLELAEHYEGLAGALAAHELSHAAQPVA